MNLRGVSGVRMMGGGLAAGLRVGLVWWLVAGGPGMRTAAGQGGGTMLVEPPGPLLPGALGGYRKVAPAAVGDGLGQIAGAEADVLKEDGIRRFERAEYSDGKARGTVSAYQFIDRSGAYAAFCYRRVSGGGVAVRRVGDNAVSTADGLVFQSGGNLVVARFDGQPARMDAVLSELVSRLPKIAGPASQPPVLPGYLPEKGLVAGSARYALGPVAYAAMGGVLPPEMVRFDKSAEAVTGSYQAGWNKAGSNKAGSGGRGEKLLTILLYPTPTIAGDAGRAIEEHLKSAGGAGTATLRREGPMLMLATGAFTPGEGQALVDGIHLRNELTWNKPMPQEFHSEVRKTANLLTSIATFAGVGALAAVLLGLFLGGARAGIRVLMGKPAASEPEFLRIDLSGAGAGGLRRSLGDETGGTPGR